MNQKIIDQIKNIIIEAGDISIQMRNQGLKVQQKTDGSSVTNADIAVSDYIFEGLKNITTAIPVICEEKLPNQGLEADKFWLIDPIDGTKGYIKGEDIFTVNIALIENQKAKYGFIYLPVTRKIYYTNASMKLVIEQNGELLNKNQSFHKTGLTATVSKNNFNDKTQEFLLNNNIEHIIKLSSSYKLCIVAEKIADMYPKFSATSEWDIAAGHAILKASGGNVIDQSTKQELLYGKQNWLNSNFVAYKVTP
ncbi:MAG: hypothetical protein DGJ47_000271 [Rickettsiaceae bacterium]